MKISSVYILTLQQLEGIGNKTIFKIVENYPREISSLSDLYSAIKSLKGKKLLEITEEELAESYKTAQRIISLSKEHGIGLISYFDNLYPKQFRYTINEAGKFDPPLLLWYRGNLDICNLPSIAIIGTREVTPEGKLGGEYLAQEFAKRNFNIISGLALGSDTCGHIGALRQGGKTTAILANGLDFDSIYPAENKKLAEEIVSNNGLLLSEYPIGQNVNRYSLVARDRLQAGLALATLVVQTGIKGGTMHAAITTLKSNKPLYVMKFKSESINNHVKCLGNKYLAEQGAHYISGASSLDDICNDIVNFTKNKSNLFD